MKKRREWMTKKRLEKDLTQHELARRVGVSNRTISNIETGHRTPSGKLALKIARELGFDMDLFFQSEKKNVS